MRIPMLALIAAGVFVACTWPTTVCGCSPAPSSIAMVTGTVRTANDAPLGGAFITARNSTGRCPVSSQADLGSQAYATSDSAGRYRLAIGDFVGTADSLCVQLVARRSASATADTLLSVMVPLQLRHTPPYDSARVDLRFP